MIIKDSLFSFNPQYEEDDLAYPAGEADSANPVIFGDF